MAYRAVFCSIRVGCLPRRLGWDPTNRATPPSAAKWRAPAIGSRPGFGASPGSKNRALLYWMTGAAFRLGLGPDLAPRLPVACMAVAFLAFYWWILRREFGCRAAWLATLILGTSVEWLGFSQIGVTDLPLAATFSAAMLLALPWIAKGDARGLPLAGALLGRGGSRQGPGPAGAGRAARALGLAPSPARLAAAGCTASGGRAAVVRAVLLEKRPAFCGGAVSASAIRASHHHGPAACRALVVLCQGACPPPCCPGRRWACWPAVPRSIATAAAPFVLALVGWGMVMFSLAPNKLPGYLLPLVPAAAVLLALALEGASTASAALLLAACAALLVAFPVIGPMLPAAIGTGLSRAPRPVFEPIWLLPLAMVPVVWLLERQVRPARTLAAVACIAAGATAGAVYLKRTAMPQVDRQATSRRLWAAVAPQAARVCVENIHRNWRFPLNYYSVTPLPECSASPRPVHIRQVPGQPPEVDTVDPLASGSVTSRFRD